MEDAAASHSPLAACSQLSSSRVFPPSHSSLQWILHLPPLSETTASSFLGRQPEASIKPLHLTVLGPRANALSTLDTVDSRYTDPRSRRSEASPKASPCDPDRKHFWWIGISFQSLNDGEDVTDHHKRY
jgi:hypothetical protein